MIKRDIMSNRVLSTSMSTFTKALGRESEEGRSRNGEEDETAGRGGAVGA